MRCPSCSSTQRIAARGYLSRMHHIPWMLETAAERHREGTAAGRTAVARLVESAIAQLDLMLEDPALGGIARPDQDGDPSRPISRVPSTSTSAPRWPPIADALGGDVLAGARDDEHPGVCFLPDGEEIYGTLARLHTSMTYSPDELHAVGREIVGQVHEELKATADGLWGTTDIAEIFERLSNDPALRYRSRDEMLEHARHAVAAGRSRGTQMVRCGPRPALCRRARTRGRGSGNGGRLLHARRHRRLAARHLLPQHVEARRSGTATPPRTSRSTRPCPATTSS